MVVKRIEVTPILLYHSGPSKIWALLLGEPGGLEIVKRTTVGIGLQLNSGIWEGAR